MENSHTLVQDAYHHANLLLTRLDEQQRRWFVAVLAEMVGLKQGGVKMMAQVTGMTEKTIYRGLHELDNELESWTEDRVRQKGGGKAKTEL